MKTCFICNQIQPLDCFYKHPQMGDGHLGKCKTCTKRHTMERTARLSVTSLEWVEKEAARHRLKSKAFRQDGRVTKSPGIAASKAKWINANRCKRSAQLRVNNAVRDGRLLRQPCFCGAKAQAHHDDYSRPLDVVWLCPIHHGERHVEINKERRAVAFAAKSQQPISACTL